MLQISDRLSRAQRVEGICERNVPGMNKERNILASDILASDTASDMLVCDK